MAIRMADRLKAQSGSALVVALLMMMILSAIGLASIFASTFELRLSGNKRGSTEAFYRAENGIQAVVADIQNFNLSRYDSATKTYEPFADSDVPNPSTADVAIKHDTTVEGSPVGIGYSAMHFEYERFLITSTGEDQTETSPARSTCTVEEKVVRLVPTLQGGY